MGIIKIILESDAVWRFDMGNWITEIFDEAERHNTNSSEIEETKELKFAVFCQNKLFDQIDKLDGPYQYPKFGPDPWDVKISHGCGDVANELEKKGLHQEFIIDFLISIWERFSCRQVEKNQTYYRASLALRIADYFLEIRDIGSAFRWELMGYASDLLIGNMGNDAGTRGKLGSVFCVSQSFLDRFQKIAQKKRSLLGCAFPEDVIAEFAKTNLECAILVARDSQRRQFYLDPYYLEKILKDNTDGASFELLAFYLSLMLPGWVPQWNVVPNDETAQQDVLITNVNNHDDFLNNVFGRHILVECKNTAENVGVQDLGYFIFRMTLAHCKTGLLFVRNEITGTANHNVEKNARALITRSFHEHNLVCIVITKKDLETIVSEAKNDNGLLGVNMKNALWMLLVKKYNQIQIGTAVTKSDASETK